MLNPKTRRLLRSGLAALAITAATGTIVAVAAPALDLAGLHAANRLDGDQTKEVRQSVIGGKARTLKRLAGGRGREVGGQLALGREVALGDAGALADPLVGGVDLARQLLVAHHARREIGAHGAHDGSNHQESPAAVGVGPV